MPYPYAEARLLHLSARLAIQMGQSAAGQERLAGALAIFQRLGARKDLERVEQDLVTVHARAV
jgi:hypothetical protein